jgi:outer membrane murein-binding lipoprotein Lpp
MKAMTNITNREPTLRDVIDKLDSLSTHVDNLSGRVDNLSTRMDTLSTRVDNLSDRVDTLSTRMDHLSADSEKFNDRFSNYQQATQWVVQLAFTLIASATITVIVSTVFRR